MLNNDFDAKELLETIKSEEFEVDGITFRINKAKGLAGFAIMEKIRIAVATTPMEDKSEDEEESEGGTRLIKALLSVSPDSIMDLLTSLMPYLDVRLEAGTPFVSYSKIKQTVDDALSPVSYYEILVRAVAVNFTESIVGLLNRIGLDL